MRSRRGFVQAALAALAAFAAPARGQARAAVPRVAILIAVSSRNEDAFRRGLREFGYVDGSNVAIERVSADGDFAKLPALAARLVATKPDVIVAFLTQASLAAKRATASIPVVMVAVSDPVASGIVADLAKPGGNVTGTAGLSAAVVGKLVEIAREVRPQAANVATLWNPSNAVYQEQSLREAEAAAKRLGLRLRRVGASDAAQLASAFAAIRAERPDAAIVLGDPWFSSRAAEIAGFMAAQRIPALGGGRLYAEAGMLASYAPDLLESSRQAARHVDRILKGAIPGDLAVEIVSKFELVLNARTAKALGITLPQPLLLRADEVIA